MNKQGTLSPAAMRAALAAVDEHSSLVARERRVLRAIVSRSRLKYGELVSWPSRRTIAEDAGLSIRSVGLALMSLRQRGILTSEGRGVTGGGRTSNRYYVKPAQLGLPVTFPAIFDCPQPHKGEGATVRNVPKARGRVGKADSGEDCPQMNNLPCTYNVTSCFDPKGRSKREGDRYRYLEASKEENAPTNAVDEQAGVPPKACPGKQEEGSARCKSQASDTKTDWSDPSAIVKRDFLSRLRDTEMSDEKRQKLAIRFYQREGTWRVFEAKMVMEEALGRKMREPIPGSEDDVESKSDFMARQAERRKAGKLPE